MEISKCMWDATESSSGIDLVIEKLDEFAVGYSGTCYCTTTADYVVNTPVQATTG